MKTILSLIILIVVCGCTSSTSKYKLTVHLIVDNKSIDINNHFDFYFLEKNKVLKPTINGNVMGLPTFSTDTVTAVFFFKQYKLQFRGVDVNELRITQNTDWTFKILNANFEQIASSLNLGKVKKLYIWEFKPLEHGAGTDLTIPVY